ncbi:hypothetical protein [Gluconobacter cerinus]|uniref:hypothetical protein n=1 Tax=Gluconobacter cerinus TaxID=38307 RepID=UPI001B8B0E03|nr:hypothetical protein [Gluconobacter cerinus]MBS1039148.1 hypothetical protein [Gluconobacter cerinus]
MYDKNFRYAISSWIVSTESEKTLHNINQEEIEIIFSLVISLIKNSSAELKIPAWKVKKENKEEVNDLSRLDINELKLIALEEMIYLMKQKIKIKIPKEYLDDKLFFSKKHDNGF